MVTVDKKMKKSLTLYRMGLFRAAYGWVGQNGHPS